MLQPGSLLSAAGSAVMGGVACNGWRFWSLPDGANQPADQQAAPPPATKSKATKSSPSTIRQIRRVPNQRGVPEGQTKWFCAACMQSFLAESLAPPAACPQGHAAEARDGGDGF